MTVSFPNPVIKVAAAVSVASLLLGLPSEAKASTNTVHLAPGVEVSITCRNSPSLPGNPAAVTVELDTFHYDLAVNPGSINFASLLISADFEAPQGVNEPVDPPHTTVRYTKIFFGGAYELSNANVNGSFTTDVGNEYELPRGGVGVRCNRPLSY